MILNRLNQLIKLSIFVENRSFSTNTDIIEHQKRVAKFRNQYGNKVIDRITVDQLFGGMRNVKSLVTETSFLDPDNGIYFRNYPIEECCKQLAKISNTNQPLPESVFYLLLTGDLPTQDQIKEISKFWAKHSEIPSHVVKMINNFPSNLHPMSQFSAAIVASSTESLFTKAYSNGVVKSTYWEYTLDDVMRIIAKLPTIAALIYSNLYRDSSSIGVIDLNKDWSENFTNMLGYQNKDFTDFMRLYLTILSDHEGGNVSTHASHLVSSTLSNPYQAFSAAMNGLAGPLHGAASQTVLNFILDLANKFNSYEIEDDKLKQYILNQLNNGHVIPGFGHAVLRKTDPRYIIQREFALKHLPNYPMLKLVSQLYRIVPPILLETGKVKNPWPNVDAHSGVLLQYYGIKDTNYYPVLIGISRSIGSLSNIILDRALNKRLINPDSLSVNEIFKMFQFN